MKRGWLAAMAVAVGLVLTGLDPVLTDDPVDAAAAVVMEARTGRVLYEQNAHEPLPMASTTKIMTTLLTLEQPDLEEPFVVDEEAIQVEGSSMGLQVGDTVTLLDLAYGGEELCRSLRREYGVSLLATPSMEQLEEADVLVMFAPRRELSRKNPIVLILYEGEEQSLPPLTLPPTLEEKLPVGCSRPQLLAALQEAGVLRTGQITVGTLGCDRIPSEKAE